MLIYLIHPIANIIITLLRHAVITKNYPICSFVISLCYSSKSLLPSCVPYLQFYIPPINWNILDFEINAYGRDERRREVVVAVAQEQARFSNGRVADQQQLDEVVVSSRCRGHGFLNLCRPRPERAEMIWRHKRKRGGIAELSTRTRLY